MRALRFVIKGANWACKYYLEGLEHALGQAGMQKKHGTQAGKAGHFWRTSILGIS